VLLEASGMSMPAFQIAGGILLFLLALDMIFASQTGLRSRTGRKQEGISYEHDVSVFPLAIPLLAGPGAITTVLLYAGKLSATELVVFVAVLLAVPLHRYCCSPWLHSTLPASCVSSARPDLTSLRGCSASSSRPWPFSLSSTA
jgi:small neutral amino acid transporter SnatA (MarC family)